MKLAAMQPYFFPYLGQFDLLNQVDIWIAYDPCQYIRHGWINRNRVLHPAAGWQYITVPLKKHAHITPINQIGIANEYWKGELFKKLQHYHRRAPFYRQVIAFLEEALAHVDSNLVKMNVNLFEQTARLLGVHTPIFVFSSMSLELEPVRGPANLALTLCQAVGAHTYINPPGGASLYAPQDFTREGIQLIIQSYTPMIYDCSSYEFIPNLSILDVLMWNSPETIKRYLDILRLRAEASIENDPID